MKVYFKALRYLKYRSRNVDPDNFIFTCYSTNGVGNIVIVDGGGNTLL